MALEDEIINIDQLDVAKEIQVGDLILIETTDGTKLIDFKDFIIGTDNITFYDKLSALEDETGAGLLKASNIEALSSKYTYHESLLSSISAVSNDLSNLDTKLQTAIVDINTISSQIDANVTLASYTTSKVGFAASRYAEEQYPQSISFTDSIFTGSDIVTYSLREVSGQSSSFKYVAVGTYTLQITGFLTFKANVTSEIEIEDTISLIKNGVPAGQFFYNDTSVRNASVFKKYTIPISTVIKLVSGDVLTFSITSKNGVTRMIGGNIAGVII
jgi:hypothetical protein